MFNNQLKITYPGELINNELKERKISQKEFAEAVGVGQSYLNDIIKGRRRISLSFAKRTEELLGVSRQTLMNMQLANDILCKDSDCTDAIELEARRALDTINQFVSAKTLLKVLKVKCTRCSEQVKVLNECFGITKEGFQTNSTFIPGYFRRSASTGLDKRMINTWIAIAKATSRFLKPEGCFDITFMQELCDKIVYILHRNEGRLLMDIRAVLSAYGIGLLIVEKVDRASIDGYSFYNNGIPYIALTCRYDRIDNLAFNIMHELGHIALGHTTPHTPQLNIDVRSFDDELCDNVEGSANEFAANFLIPNGLWRFAPTMPWNPYNIQIKYIQWAQANNLNPWIVLGRLSYETGMYKFRSDDSRKISGGKEGLCYDLAV